MFHTKQNTKKNTHTTKVSNRLSDISYFRCAYKYLLTWLFPRVHSLEFGIPAGSRAEKLIYALCIPILSQVLRHECMKNNCRNLQCV